MWVKTTNNSKNSKWVLCKLASDNNNHLYVGSRGDNDSIVYDNTPITTSQGGNGDGYSSIFKTDTAGNLLCSSLLAGGGDDMNGMAVDVSGRYVYLGGDLLEQMILNATDTLYKGGSQFGPQEVPFIARWQPCSACSLPINTNIPATLCNGQSDTLTASGGTTYTWSPSTGLSATTGSSVIAAPAITTTYTIFGTDTTCSGTVQTVVNVIPSPNQPTFTQHNDTLISSSVHDNQWYLNNKPLKNDTSQYLIITTLGWYWVVVSNEANGCSTASDSMNVSSLTGLNQLSLNNHQLLVYPNPSSDFVYVNLTQQRTQPVQISLYNMLGQEVYTTLTPSHSNSNPTATIPVTGLPDGVYVLRVNEGSVSMQKEVVVAR